MHSSSVTNCTYGPDLQVYWSGSLWSLLSAQDPWVVGREDAEDPVEVLDRGELDRHLALRPAELDLDPRVEGVLEAGCALVERLDPFPGPGRGARLARGRPGPRRDGLLGRTHREALGDDACRELLHRLGVRQPEQRAGVPRGEHPRRDAALDRRGEAQEAQGVGDLGPRAVDALCELLLGAAEVVEQLLVRGGLLERVELRAVQVLQQGVAQQVGVVRLADVRGHFRESCGFRRTPAAL